MNRTVPHMSEMQSMSQEELSRQETMARINALQHEVLLHTEETLKYVREERKLDAEARKLDAEAQKLNREKQWHGVVVGAALSGATASLVLVVLRLLGKI